MNTETENSNTEENASITKSKKRSTAKKASPTKSVKSKTEAKPVNTANPWSVRGVDLETRAIIDRAASKQNKHLGEYFNQDIREFCTGQIKKSQVPPASPTDIKEMITAEMTVMKTDILAAMLAAQQQQAPATDRKTFLQKLRELF